MYKDIIDRRETMQKPKVVNIITRISVGGAAIHVVNISYGMREDFDSILVSGQIEPYESDMSYYAQQYDIPIVNIKDMKREISWLSDIKAFFQLISLLKKEKPDIVNTHLAKAGALGRLTAYLAGVKKIYHTFHGNYYNGNFSKTKVRFFLFIERLLARISTKIIVLSEKEKQDLVDLGIAKADKFEVIRLGFDFTNFVATPEDNGRFREQFHIPKDALVIALVGRITFQKNPALFVKIAQRFADKNVYFPLIGDGDLKDEMQKEIDRLGLQKKVIITGFIRDLKSVYADIDVVLVSSFFEGTCMVLVEGMANGKIVLSTNVGGISDYLVNEVNGFLVSEPTVECFVEKINDIIEQKIDKKTISENAKSTALDIFALERLVVEMRELFNS